jgi:U3 small nucleolar RNA-associated protein 4
MEYKVHRCKFSDWKPSPIRSIAVDGFSPLVAVGREDGDIEVSNSGQKWFVQTRVPGSEGFQLRHLAFSAVEQEQGRLFGISLRGVLFEVDFARLCIKNIRDSYGGAAWSLAASARSAVLAVGCEDGAARLFTYEGNGLEYLRSFPSAGARVLSLAFHPRLPQLFTGCADGTIRCMEETSGQAVFRLTGDIYRGLSTHIWSLLVLSDSTVVSGDNRGHLQFWDGVTGVLMSTLHQHTADILCIAASRDESQIFASGVDSKVICVKRISATFRLPTGQPAGQDDSEACRDPSLSQWVYTTAHRPHTHDVHSLAVCPSSVSTFKDGQRTVSAQETLLSGGIDSKLCIYSIGDFMKSRPSWVLPTPARGLVGASTDQHTLAMRHGQHVNIWHLEMSKGDAATAATTSTATSTAPPPGLVLDSRLEVGTSAFVHTLAVSPEGGILAVSSASGTRMYALGGPGAEPFTRLPVPQELSRCLCQTMAFSPDNKSFVAVYSSSSAGTTIVTLNVESDSAPPASSKKKRKTENNNSHDDSSPPGPASVSVSLRHMVRHSASVRDAMLPLGSSSGLLSSGSANSNGHSRSSTGNMINGLEYVCNLSTINADSKWFAVASANCRVYVYETDGLVLHWRLPAFPSPVSALAFHALSSSALVVVLADNSFWIFDVALRQLSPWSVQYGEKIPSAVRNIPGPIEGVVFDSDKPSVVIFYGQGFSVFADLNDAIPEIPKRITPMLNVAGGGLTKKQKKKNRKSSGGVSDSSNFAVVSTYRSLVHVGCTRAGGAELVVLENPWVHILGALPDTLSRERYGT